MPKATREWSIVMQWFAHRTRIEAWRLTLSSKARASTFHRMALGLTWSFLDLLSENPMCTILVPPTSTCLMISVEKILNCILFLPLPLSFLSLKGPKDCRYYFLVFYILNNFTFLNLKTCIDTSVTAFCPCSKEMQQSKPLLNVGKIMQQTVPLTWYLLLKKRSSIWLLKVNSPTWIYARIFGFFRELLLCSFSSIYFQAFILNGYIYLVFKLLFHPKS